MNVLTALQTKASLKAAFLVLGLFLLNAVLLGMVDRPLEALAGGEQKLDLRFGYDAATVERLFSAYGAEGRALYGWNLLVDTPFPVLGGLAAILFVLAVFPARPWRHLLLAAPMIFIATDLVENILLFSLSRMYPGIPESLVGLSSAVTQVKRSAFYLTVTVMVVSGLAAAWMRLNRRTTRAAWKQ